MISKLASWNSASDDEHQPFWLIERKGGFAISRLQQHTSARSKVVEHFLDHAPEVVETCQHESPVNVLEWLVEDPELLAILAHKCAVGRDPDVGLD